jgi:hypothetical protein
MDNTKWWPSYHGSICHARGGISRSERKVAVAGRNIQKATEARRRPKRVLTPEQQQQQQWKESVENITGVSEALNKV